MPFSPIRDDSYNDSESLSSRDISPAGEEGAAFDILQAQENLAEATYRMVDAAASLGGEALPVAVSAEESFDPIPVDHVLTDPPLSSPPPSSFLSSPSPDSQAVSSGRQEWGSHPFDQNVKFARPKGESVFWIDIEKIVPNPYQPRREFGDDALQNLSDSILVHGVLQPIIVVKTEMETPRGLDVRYQLIAGERRWRAAKQAGLREIPAIIKRGQPAAQQKLEWALIENVQREDLNSVERGRAFKQLMDEFRISQREIANRIGKSREYVANTIRLLALPQEMQSAVASNVISEGHARALLSLQGIPENQKKLFEDIKEHQLAVRDAELATRAILGIRRPTKRRNAMFLDPEVRFAQSKLEETLGTKVLLQKDGERGKIVVEFYSNEELRAILDKIVSKEA